jgi:hypothetical protein
MQNLGVEFEMAVAKEDDPFVLPASTAPALLQSNSRPKRTRGPALDYKAMHEGTQIRPKRDKLNQYHGNLSDFPIRQFLFNSIGYKIYCFSKILSWTGSCNDVTTRFWGRYCQGPKRQDAESAKFESGH